MAALDLDLKFSLDVFFNRLRVIERGRSNFAEQKTSGAEGILEFILVAEQYLIFSGRGMEKGFWFTVQHSLEG